MHSLGWIRTCSPRPAPTAQPLHCATTLPLLLGAHYSYLYLSSISRCRDSTSEFAGPVAGTVATVNGAYVLQGLEFASAEKIC